MQQYNISTPILNDSLFLLYGGMTGTSTPAQRSVAYSMAEEQMVEYLGAFLVPTLVSGTHFWRGPKPLELDFGWIMSVQSVSIRSVQFNNGCQIETATGCYAIRNPRFGYLDVNYLVSCGGCSSIVGLPPYQIDVVYQSGMSTGTYTSPSMLQALTLAAQVNLNEIDVSLANESIADAGLEFFINQRYHEKRLKGITTVFGNSAVANRIARLVRRLRARPGTAVY